MALTSPVIRTKCTVLETVAPRTSVDVLLNPPLAAPHCTVPTSALSLTHETTKELSRTSVILTSLVEEAAGRTTVGDPDAVDEKHAASAVIATAAMQILTDHLRHNRTPIAAEITITIRWIGASLAIRSFYWTCTHLSDSQWFGSGRGRRLGGFEGDGAEVAKAPVPTIRVVPRFDIGEDGLDHIGT